MKVWVLGLLLVLSIGAFAGTTGKIAGVITDAQTKEPLVGAAVVIEGTRLGAATNVDGYYVILNVTPGKYTLTVSSVGFKKKTITGVAVSVDLTTTQNVEMIAEALEQEEVVVTAERPVVRKDLTSSEARVDASTIETLPVTEVQEVLSLQAGVTLGRDGIHIRGGRTSEVAYWVDGISVSDVYDGGQSVQVDNSGIQELQVISGTFNAEYGQAMSGIVNIVTKDGDEKFRGSVSTYFGDYFSSDKNIYYNIDDFNWIANKNLQGSISGPLFSGATFYLSGRFFKTDGWLYGNRVFDMQGNVVNMPDSIVFSSNGESVTIIPGNNPVPMNNRELTQGQAKLAFQVGGGGKLTISGLGSRTTYRDYNHDLFYVPDGDAMKYDKSFTGSVLWTHTLSSSAFYTLNVSYLYRDFKEYQFEDPLDSRQLIDPDLPVKPLQSFNFYNTNNHHFKRRTETRVAKFDYTDQVSSLHQVKLGVEGRLHRLYFEDYNTTFDSEIFNRERRYVHAIPLRTSPNYEEYTEKPTELSAYIQDKLEYKNMIVNIGLRYDYFNSNGKVLADPLDPNVYLPQRAVNQADTSLASRKSYWYKNAKGKSSFSPRFGISYPITDRGILHFSYGHFLQIPSFQYLYQKPEFKVTSASGTQGNYGNADLEPQKTVMYEFGLQQQLSDDLSGDVTMFYRDTRDWVTTSAPLPVRDPETATTYYIQYINRDYANSRGVTLTMNKRPSHMWSLNLSYTFQVAEGLNSSPDQQASRLQGGADTVQTLTPLDWDQTHTANLTLGFGQEDWGIYFIGRYGSGLPYTPVLNKADFRGEDAQRGVQGNSRRRPDNFTVDVRLSKAFMLGGLEVNFFAKIFNLLDRRNEIDVYGETGRATATPRNLGLENISGGNRINTVEQYLQRPQFYDEPRQVQLGFDINF
jgi:hypothetical protein